MLAIIVLSDVGQLENVSKHFNQQHNSHFELNINISVFALVYYKPLSFHHNEIHDKL
jgi:hypothetical protein